MQKLAKEMGEEGEYAVYVGSLTTPLLQHRNRCGEEPTRRRTDPRQLNADRLRRRRDRRTSKHLDVIKTYLNLKGIYLWSNGPDRRRQCGAKRPGGDGYSIGTVMPSQAKPLIMDGTIREGYLWNLSDAGHAMVAVAKLVLDGTPIVDGVEIPGLGKAVVDVEKADQGQEDHDRQQGHHRWPDQAGPLTAARISS